MPYPVTQVLAHPSIPIVTWCDHHAKYGMFQGVFIAVNCKTTKSDSNIICCLEYTMHEFYNMAVYWSLLKQVLRQRPYYFVDGAMVGHHFWQLFQSQILPNLAIFGMNNICHVWQNPRLADLAFPEYTRRCQIWQPQILPYLANIHPKYYQIWQCTDIAISGNIWDDKMKK